QAGLDWRRLILSRCLSGRALLVAQLKSDPRYRSEAERVRAFVAAGGGSRSSYFNWSRELPAPVTPSAIFLRNPPPAAKPTDPDLVVLQPGREAVIPDLVTQFDVDFEVGVQGRENGIGLRAGVGVHAVGAVVDEPG